MRMVIPQLRNVSIILGSQSPRRKELLEAMDIDFVVEVFPTDEQVKAGLLPEEVVEQIARHKLRPFQGSDYMGRLIITADTIVASPQGEILGKPRSKEEAIATIRSLSGNEHVVLTAVAMRLGDQTRSFVEKTTVRFRLLDLNEIQYYVEKYCPMDKAGSYGIQEWIGRIGIDRIEGSYENVMGLPTQRLYAELKKMFQKK